MQGSDDASLHNHYDGRLERANLGWPLRYWNDVKHSGGQRHGRASRGYQTIFLLCGRTNTADWSEVSPDEESTDFSAEKYPRRGNRGAPT